MLTLVCDAATLNLGDALPSLGRPAIRVHGWGVPLTRNLALFRPEQKLLFHRVRHLNNTCRQILALLCHPRYVCPFFVAEPGWRAGCGVVPHMGWLQGRRDGTVTAPVAEYSLQQRLRPRCDAERTKRRERGGIRGRREQVPGSERAHHQHAKSEIGCRRENLLLDRTLEGVLWDLQSPDGAGRPSRPASLRNGCGHLECVGPMPPNTTAGLHRRSWREPLGPGQQVVDLVDVDVPAEEAKRAGYVLFGLAVVSAPDLRRDDRAIPRRPSRVRPSTRSASPDIGDESNRVAPASNAASTTSRRFSASSPHARRMSARSPSR